MAIRCEEKLDLCPNCRSILHGKEKCFYEVTIKGLYKFVQSPMLRVVERDA